MLLTFGKNAFKQNTVNKKVWNIIMLILEYWFKLRLPFNDVYDGLSLTRTTVGYRVRKEYIYKIIFDKSFFTLKNICVKNNYESFIQWVGGLYDMHDLEQSFYGMI